MPETTQDIILGELRALRLDFNAYARETGERVSVIETDMHSLMGNGNPGRIALIERSVECLKQWRWWLVGASAGVVGVISMLAWVVEARK